MTFRTLLVRNLTFYWRTNLAVVLGVAVAVSVLAGALVVGQSVRASLRELALLRLGRTTHLIAATGFFRDELAKAIAADGSPSATTATQTWQAAPIIALSGVAAHDSTGRRATGVAMYGVDERFWALHGRSDLSGPTAARDVWLSESLARELGAAQGDTLLLRVQMPSAIPLESLHASKEDIGRTVRVRASRVLAAADLGEFSVQAQQGAVHAVFLPIARLQRDLDQPGRANAIVATTSSPDAAGDQAALEELARVLQRHVTVEDLDLTVRALPDRGQLALESGAGYVPNAVVAAAVKVAGSSNLQVSPVLAYLANRLERTTATPRRADDQAPRQPQGASRESRMAPGGGAPRALNNAGRPVPYSLLAAMDLAQITGAPVAPAGDRPPIVLNEWAAREMAAEVGDTISVEYYLWTDAGALETRTAVFAVAAIVPLSGAARDPDLAPRYPGITETANVADWDPPFPVDLAKVLPADEAYWDEHRATPKAFIPLEAGQRLWQSRYGRVTSLRLTPAQGAPLEDTAAVFRTALVAAIRPADAGFSLRPVRAEALAASGGATDFGEYFLYFSFFLLVSALLLAALLFRLGIEQRVRELGLLQALGVPVTLVRRLFLAEGIVLSALGAAIGIAGTLGYAAVIMLGLRTWWLDAVGTTALSVRPSAMAVGLGVAGGLVTAIGCIWWTLRTAVRVSPRALLGGSWEHVGEGAGASPPRRRRLAPAAATISAGLGLALALLAAAGLMSRVAGFFGAGTLFLIAALTGLAAWLRRPRRDAITGRGWLPVSRLGFRYAAYRPGRSLLCITLIASATFIIVAVEAFRRTGTHATQDRASGTGGYLLMAESALPLVHDPDTPAGRDDLNLAADEATLAGVRIDRFRLRPGDDASCLNLYKPTNPRILGAPEAFLNAGRFAFQSSLAASDAERANPWLLLKSPSSDGSIPVIADANSLTYVLHLALGDELVLERAGTTPVRLRVVAALRDSVLQGELVMAESQFIRAFPDEPGYRWFFIDAPPDRAADVATTLEHRLADFGFDVMSPAERLQTFHRVENTYLSTFQTLGALGLLLGTLGLSIVLWRNVLERRRDLALLRAVGYDSADLTTVVLAENVLLLAAGLAAGFLCAVLAITPALLERGGRLPSWSVGGLLLAVLATGLLASVVATVTALRAPLLAALRAE